jgi:hypothetical protein
MKPMYLVSNNLSCFFFFLWSDSFLRGKGDLMEIHSDSKLRDQSQKHVFRFLIQDLFVASLQPRTTVWVLWSPIAS